jgi:hypothetical protein
MFTGIAATRADLDAEEQAFADFQRKCKADIGASTECYKCAGKGKIRGFGHRTESPRET